MDFLTIEITRAKGNSGTIIKPDFLAYVEGKPIEDLLIKGGDFYAMWDEANYIWQTKENIALALIDKEIDRLANEYVKATGDEDIKILYLRNTSNAMIDRWHKYCQKQVRDNFVPLDCRVTFQSEAWPKSEHISKHVPYALPAVARESDYSNWDILMSTLYSPEERLKIEWCIGAIVSGDSTWIQKFAVFYGDAGSGKSTVLNVIDEMFAGYTCTFDAQALTNANASFSLEPFKNNPLVAIQHDSDLSKISENTRLNSIVSHERMTIDEKFKSKYENRFLAMLFMGTNRPVRITEGKSGLLRRLIDISPSGNKLSASEYKKVTKGVKYEHGAIARHCLDVYLDNKDIYDKYIPLRMIDATNDTFNFMVDNYRTFVSENEIKLKRIWDMYKLWVEDCKVPWPLSKRDLKEELKSYFKTYDQSTNTYSELLTKKFESEQPEIKEIHKDNENWIEFKEQSSIFDLACSDCDAQYTNEEGLPSKKWDDVHTKLADINTHQLHYVRVPINHIVIDFDIKNKNGEKDISLNLEEAKKWPPTYAEVSKSGAGIHLHYIYDGDPEQLSSIFDDKIEIKVFKGKSALRRCLTLCTANQIAHISSGLPLKKEVAKLLDQKTIDDEKKLRAIIKKCLRKEIHPSTKSNVDFIAKLLNDAYSSGLKYDVSDLEDSIFSFAAQSTNQSSQCIKIISALHYKSDEPSLNIDNSDDDTPICWFDIEVFPNLFLVCYKVEGTDRVVPLINPKPSEIEALFKYRLVGFNNRNYDNHLIYACYLGYTVKELYEMSHRIIYEGKGLLRESYNISYTDIYDYMSDKMSLKKLEYKMGIEHDELGYDWDEEVDPKNWPRVVEYCTHDVEATEKAWYYTAADFMGRKILADLAGMTVNDTTNTLTGKFIFGDERHPQRDFKWRDLSKPVSDDYLDPESLAFLREVFPDMMAQRHGEANSLLPYFPGYKFENGKSTYLGEVASEGGYAKGVPGYYVNCALLDIMSMHPHSALTEVIFGPVFTRAFYQIVYGRVHIKHKAWEIIDGFLDGKLKPYIEKCKNGEMKSKDLAFALKIAINSVYGLTAAHFDNLFKNPDNIDNIVAKRGSLFMIELRTHLRKLGIQVCHVKTDSIKIPNATKEVIDYVTKFGKRYGYFFEHEATYEKMVLLNDAVYIARYATPEHCKELYGYVPGDNADHAEDHRWTATGTQFMIPYVFKKLFSKEELEFEDLCQTFSVAKGSLYLDLDEHLDIAGREALEKELSKLETHKKKLLKNGESTSDIDKDIDTLKAKISEMHNLKFVGRVGRFMPIKPGCDGGVLYRVADGKLNAASGTTGYRWLESYGHADRLADLDYSYWNDLVDKAKAALEKYVPYDYFIEHEVHPFDETCCCANCEECCHLRVFDYCEGTDEYECVCDTVGHPALGEETMYRINQYAFEHNGIVVPF